MSDIQERAEALASEICDCYCKHPMEASCQEVLDDICECCPLNKLMEMID